MGAAVLLGLLNGSIVQFVGINAFIVTLGTMTAVRGLILLYTDGRSVSVTVPEVTDVMKSFEGGRHDGFWFILILGFAMLAYGAYIGFRGRTAGQPLRPAVVGYMAGGLAFLFLAWASGGELPTG